MTNKKAEENDRTIKQSGQVSIYDVLYSDDKKQEDPKHD